MYHGVTGSNDEINCWWQISKIKFEEQIKYIHETYNVISLDEALDIIHDPKKDFYNNIVITFDDGYKNVKTNAYPILEKYQLPFTIYVTTGPIEKEQMIWSDEIYDAILSNNIDFIDLTYIGIHKSKKQFDSDRIKYAEEALEFLKNMTKEEKDDILAKFRTKVAHCLYTDTNQFRLLTKADVIELSSKSIVTIGAHTINHELLTNIPLSKARDEIVGSKQILENWIDLPVIHFAYPNGNFSYDIKQELDGMGFNSAVITGCDMVQTQDTFQLNRFGIGAWDSMAFFKSLVSGLITELKNIY